MVYISKIGDWNMLEINAVHEKYSEAIDLINKTEVLFSVTETRLDKDVLGAHKGPDRILLLLCIVDLEIYLENVSGGYGDGRL